MNIRSQGVPLKTRYIREDPNRFHPMSDGADFKPSPVLEQEIVRAQYEAYCSDAGIRPEPEDDFPIDDEQQEADQEGWEHAHELAKQLDKLRQDYEKNLALNRECIEFWQGEAKRLNKELAEAKEKLAKEAS